MYRSLPRKVVGIKLASDAAIISNRSFPPRAAHAFRILPSSYMNNINNERNNSWNLSSTVVIIRRMASDLPYHLVVGMPALSPTMVSGTVSEWKIEEGSAFQAGDSIAEIQTDKASIAFEAQDDGYIAKHLVPAGTEVNVGEPIMVTVEDEEYVKAFADFVLPPPSAATTKMPQQEAPAGETPKATVTIPPPKVLPPAVSAAAASPPPSLLSVPTVSVPATPPPDASSISLLNTITTSSSAVSSTPSWGKLAKSSPIAKVLRASQQKYIDTYGLTGQKPL